MRSILPYALFISSWTAEVELSLKNGFNQFLISLAVKWRSARDEHIQDNTHAPDVAFFVIFVLNNLRRHEKSGAYDAMHLLILIYAARRTKVDQLHDIVFNPTKVNVVRLNVTMDDARVV